MARSQFYCSACQTWFQRSSDTPTREQRRQHAARCLGDLTHSEQIAELDRDLERIADLYVQ